MESNPTQPIKPNSHMPMAIISTVLSVITCNFIPATIFGVVSIVYASKVNSKYDLGDYEGARRASRNAKTWWIVTLATVVVLLIISAIALYYFVDEAFMEEFMKEYERELEKRNS
jgi:H+/Cl- antiporter ClcA